MSTDLIRTLHEDGWNVVIKTDAMDQDAIPYTVTATTKSNVFKDPITVSASAHTIERALSEVAEKAHIRKPIAEWNNERELYVTIPLYINLGTSKAYSDKELIDKAIGKIYDEMDKLDITVGDAYNSEIRNIN